MARRSKPTTFDLSHGLDIIRRRSPARAEIHRIEARAEFLRKMAGEVEAGKLRQVSLLDVKLGLWQSLHASGEEPTTKLNALLELGRQANRALLAIACRVGADPERLLEPREVNRVDSIPWAFLGSKLQAVVKRSEEAQKEKKAERKQKPQKKQDAGARGQWGVLAEEPRRREPAAKDAGWTFGPGWAAFNGKEFCLRGRGWTLLKALADKPEGIMEDELREAGWPGEDALQISGETIRTQLYRLRQKIRAGLNLPTEFDPIPVLDYGCRRAWALAERLLPKRLAARDGNVTEM